MKKLTFIVLITIIALGGFAQKQSIPWLKVEDITDNDNFIWHSDTLDFTSLSTTDVVKYTDSTTIYATPSMLTPYVLYNDSTTTFATPYQLLSYPLFSDSITTFVTPTQLTTAINSTPEKSVFSITLPSASTVADRVAGAINVPTGWTLTADGLNLNIQHDLGRYTANVTVWAVNYIVYQQLAGTAAHNGLTMTNMKLSILSLATISAQIEIYVILE